MAFFHPYQTEEESVQHQYRTPSLRLPCLFACSISSFFFFFFWWCVWWERVSRTRDTTAKPHKPRRWTSQIGAAAAAAAGGSRRTTRSTSISTSINGRNTRGSNLHVRRFFLFGLSERVTAGRSWEKSESESESELVSEFASFGTLQKDYQSFVWSSEWLVGCCSLFVVCCLLFVLLLRLLLFSFFSFSHPRTKFLWRKYYLWKLRRRKVSIFGYFWT